MRSEPEQYNVTVATIADDGNLCGECPLWDSGVQSLYWTDAVGRKLFRYDWQTQSKHVLLEDFEVNSCALDESGSLALANHGGVWLWNGMAPPIPIAREVDGRRMHLNDCIADPSGRLLPGSNFYATSGK